MKLRFRSRLPSKHDCLVLVIGAIIACAGFGIIHLVKSHQSAVPYQASGINSPWIPSTVKYWQGPIDEMSKKYNVDPDFVAIIMTLESGGYAKAGSSADAHGLMQVTPLTAKDIAAKYLKKPVKSYDLWDPKTNIEFGTAYLAYLRKTFGTAEQGPSWNSTVELVAAGYNGGPLASLHLGEGKGLQDPQTVIYSRDAFNMWRERHSAKSPTYSRWLDRGGSTLVDAAKKAGQ